MMQYEVTIGIPVYKARGYIAEALLSALSQTYADIEFLLVDDCGDDGAMAVVDDLMHRHPRGAQIRLLHNDRNLGVGPSRNRIIDEARGRYLYFMDADDTIAPDTIRLLVEAMHRHHADVAYASYEKIDLLYHTAPEVYQYPPAVFSSVDEFAAFVFSQYNRFQVSACNCLMDINFLRCNKLRFIDAMFWEDMAFTYDMATKAACVVLLPDVTYHYQCHADSLSHYQDREVIYREEILKNASTIDYLKWRSYKLRHKYYISDFSYVLQMNSFYIVCHVMKYRNRISPSISNRELQHMMKHPAPLSSILRFRHKRLSNLFLWLLSWLPLPLFMATVYLLGKMKKVI